jgi:vancomycin permeability regulator SanA
MDRVILDLSAIVQREVEAYAEGDWWEASAFAVSDTVRKVYTTVVVPAYPRKYKAGLVVMARVDGDRVIIEHDTTDHPLVEELIAAGIPREQIILTYAGESLPENAQPS